MSSLYRAGRKNTPILLSHRRDVSLSTSFTKTQSRKTLLVDDDKIVATEENFRFMSNAAAHYIDGTAPLRPGSVHIRQYLLPNTMLHVLATEHPMDVHHVP